MKPYLAAFAFPFRRDNIGVMLLGAAFFIGLPVLLSYIPFGGGILSMAVGFFLLLYYALFLHSILHAAMQGEDRFPAWPEVESATELGSEVLSMLAPYFVSFLPLIILRCVYGFGSLGESLWGYAGLLLSGPVPLALPGAPSWVAPASWLLTALGLLYLPMALLVWTFYGGSSILNPVAVIRSAIRTCPSYLAVVLLVAILVFAAWGISRIPAGQLPCTLAVFYALTVGMRLIGTHYHRNRERLGWEAREIVEPA